MLYTFWRPGQPIGANRRPCIRIVFALLCVFAVVCGAPSISKGFGGWIPPPILLPRTLPLWTLPLWTLLPWTLLPWTLLPWTLLPWTLLPWTLLLPL